MLTKQKENPEPGYTEEQCEIALKQATQPLVERAKAAKARGSIGKEATRKLMDVALNAEA